MPELPDLAILADAFDAALAGRPVTAVRAVDPLVLRATPSQAARPRRRASCGTSGRRGKHLVFRLDRHDLWAAPMLTGRFGLVAPGASRPKAAVTFALGHGSGRARPPAPWVAGAPWLPADGELELRYLDPTRMGKLYLVPAGDASSVPGIAELGPDADDPALTVDEWQARIRRHPGELKALLRNQAFVAGIGNAYSDEILWEARLSPFRRRSTLAPEEMDALYAAMRSTLRPAVEILRARVPPDLREAGPRPPPGAPARRAAVPPLRRDDQPGRRREATSYCRACQR